MENLNILYVGSEEVTRRKLSENLKTANFIFVEKLNSLMKVIKTQTPIDVVFCEKELKGLDVFHLIRIIRASRGNKPIYFSLSDEQSYERKNLKIVDDFLSLPLNIDRVLERILFLRKLKPILQLQTPNQEEQYKISVSKRVFDIAFASLALSLLSPIMLLVAIAIKLESKGSFYYASKRVGSGYKIFSFLKFRSMYTNADHKLKELNDLNKYSLDKNSNHECGCACVHRTEACSAFLYSDNEVSCEKVFTELEKSKYENNFVKLKNDPRVTRVGRFIRKTSIDELPQLINVLKGDMSIVGNRPLPLYEAEKLTSDKWIKRFLAPAGLTGYWQIKKSKKYAAVSAEERKQLDVEYANKNNIFTDLKVIFATIPAMLQNENAS